MEGRIADGGHSSALSERKNIFHGTRGPASQPRKDGKITKRLMCLEMTVLPVACVSYGHLQIAHAKFPQNLEPCTTCHAGNGQRYGEQDTMLEKHSAGLGTDGCSPVTIEVVRFPSVRFERARVKALVLVRLSRKFDVLIRVYGTHNARQTKMGNRQRKMTAHLHVPFRTHCPANWVYKSLWSEIHCLIQHTKTSAGCVC